MKITGNFNPKTGTEEEYTVDFEQELTQDTIFNCNIWDEVKGEAGFFSATIQIKNYLLTFTKYLIEKGLNLLNLKFFGLKNVKTPKFLLME